MRMVSKRAPTMVWRISESSPLGEWVDLSARHRAGPSKTPPPDEEQGAWVRSSYDLLDGIEMTDDGEPVPPDIFDELFSKGNNLITDPKR